MSRSLTAWTAFTLLELIVSMTVVSVLCVLLVAMVNTSSDVWRKSEQNVDTFREARAALHFITRDLQAAVKIPANECFFLMEHSTANGNISVTGGRPAPAGHGEYLFFLSAQPADVSGGDLGIVGYYLSFWKDIDEQNGSYKLHRYYRNSSETVSLLQDRLSGVPSKFAKPESGMDEVLARNVIDFEVTPFRRDESGNLNPESGVWPATEIPALIEIRLSAFDPRTASRIKTQAEWTDSESSLRQKSLRTFETKVVMNSAQ